MASINLRYWTKVFFYQNFKTFCKNKGIERTGKSLLVYILECDRRYIEGVKKK